MGHFSIWHWLIVLAVVLILFGGGGKIPKLMKDLGQGITSFKRGLKEDEKGKATADEAAADAKRIETGNGTAEAGVSRKDTVAG
jgi:sec-independent protein translocase protein TatA